MHIMTMEKKYASESLVMERLNTPRLVEKRSVTNVPMMINSVTPSRKMTLPMVLRPWKRRGRLASRSERPREARGRRNQDQVNARKWL